MPRTVGEEVSIASVQFSERELPLWATEKTHAQLLKVLTSSSRIEGNLLRNIDKNIASLSGGVTSLDQATEDQLNALNELSEVVRQSDQNDDRRHDDSQRSESRTRKIFQSTLGEFRDIFEPTFRAFRFPDPSRIMRGFLTDIALVSKRFTLLLGGLGLVTGVIGAFFSKLQETRNAFRELTEYGVDFSSVLDTGGDRLQAFGQTAAESNLTVQEFASVLIRFSRVAARIGEKNFGALSREVASILRPVGMLGLQMDELTEFTGSYLEQQRMLGLLNLQSHTEQAQSAAENVRMLTAFAKVTGVARKEMQKMVETTLAREELMAFIQSLPPEMRTMMEKNIRMSTTALTAVFGEQAEVLMGPFSEILTRGMMFSEQSIELLRAIPTLQGPLQKYTETIKNANGNQEVVNKAVLELAETLGSTSEDTMRWLTQLANNGSEGAKQLIPLISASIGLNGKFGDLEEQLKKALEAARAEEKHRLDIMDGLNLWEDTLKRLRLIGERVFFGFLGMPFVTGKVQEALTFLESKAEGFATWLEKVVTNSFPAIQKAIDDLTKWFQSFMVDGEFQAGEMFRDIRGKIISGFVDMLGLIWEEIKKAVVEWFNKPRPQAGAEVDERQALLEKAAKEREAAGGPTPRTRAQIVADMGPLEDRVEAISKKLPDPGPPGPGNMPPKAKIVVEPPPPVEEPRSWFRAIFGGGGAKRAPVPGPGAMPGRATTPRPTPVTIVTNEEKEENNPNNEQPRSNLPGPRRPLNNNGSPIRSAEELLQETTELLRATLELGVRQTKIMEDTKNQMRNLQQGLY